jgi:hypothetical protein
MRFIVFVIDAQSRSASTDEIEAIDAFNEFLQQNGHWVTAAGISAPDQALLIDNTDDLGLVSKGSLFSTDDFYSGFWIIQAESLAAAQTLGLSASRACNRRVEIRPFLQ